MAATENWIKVAGSIDEIDFNEKGIALIAVGEKKICLIRTQSVLLACTNRCPHAGGNLNEGFIDKQQNIVCPVHHYRFNLLSGRDSMNEGYFLKRYPVRIDTKGVYVNII